MKDGFVKVAAYSPRVALGAPMQNAKTAIDAMHRADAAGAKLLVLPELFLTGYTCADLFFQTKLLTDAVAALALVIEASRGVHMLTLVGLPVAYGNRLYNCAAVVTDGRLLGLVPKSATMLESATLTS